MGVGGADGTDVPASAGAGRRGGYVAAGTVVGTVRVGHAGVDRLLASVAGGIYPHRPRWQAAQRVACCGMQRGEPVDGWLQPVWVYAALVLGGVGVCLALPRRGVNPQPVGALVAAGALGLVFVVLLARARAGGEGPASPFFYVFAVIALGASLRVITHPRPVYAALYFILTILSSAGLYVMLAAEFMAFALVIVYAGAILITYLFVIMLATQAPTAEQIEAQAEYDLRGREPVAATAAGFVLLAVLTTLLFGGVAELPPPRGTPVLDSASVLVEMPRKVERVLRRVRGAEGEPLIAADERLARDGSGRPRLDVAARTAWVEGPTGAVRAVPWPAGALEATNTERVGFNLLRDYPGSIEIAGVVLLMAMIGAVILARKKIELEQEAMRALAQRARVEREA